MSAQWCGDNMQRDITGTRLHDIKPKKLIIANLVSIKLDDGTMEFLPGYTPDAAARGFWQALSEDYRKMLKWKAEHGEDDTSR